MADQTFFAIEILRNPGHPTPQWETIEIYDFYSTALNRANVIVTDEHRLNGLIRLVRCIPLASQNIKPIEGLRK